MGVNLRELVVKKETNIKEFSGKLLAFDAFNTIYQFLSVIRQPDGTPLTDSHGNITSHLSGLFYRITNLLEQGIKPVFVFDGEKPEFKKATVEQRLKQKEESERKWKEMLEKGSIEEARKYAQAVNFLTSEMVKESKELIKAMGLPVVQAPYEGEAQTACMAKEGKVYGSASQDYDALLFGSPLLIRNLSITGRKKIPRTHQYMEIMPEIINLHETLKNLNISYEQFVCLGIIVGTDYAPKGAVGIGPKKALQIVKIYKNAKNIAKAIQDKWEDDIDFISIYEFFTNPPCTSNYSLEFKTPDEQKIKELLIDKHEFSEERVEKALKKIEEVRKKGAQKTLF